MDTYFRMVGSKVNSLQAGVHQAFKALRTAWQAATTYGTVDLIEVCCASDSVLANTVVQQGGKALRCSIWNGYDLHTRDGVEKLKQAIADNRARHVWFSPPCGPDSNIQHTNQRTPTQIEQLRKKRLRVAKIQQHVEEVYNYCKTRTFQCCPWVEQPQSCGSWNRQFLQRILATSYTCDLHGCAYNLRDPTNGLLVMKPWRFATMPRRYTDSHGAAKAATHTPDQQESV
jgi:hypothetical protein